MKNSQPIMKNKTIPTTILGKDESISKVEDIWEEPSCKKDINAEVPIIIRGWNFASQETIIAVNPIPPIVSVLTEWSRALTIKNPASPHIAPEISIVLIITFLTFIPI